MAFAALFASRVLLGISQAATYPVAAIAAAQYVPERERVGASAIYLAAGSLGAAIAPLLLAPLMVYAGWRAVFTASGIVGLLTALLWYAFAPRGGGNASAHRQVSVREQLLNAARVLRNRHLLALAMSYFLHSAVYFVFIFWFFRYLTEARGFSVLESGIWGSVPYFMCFAIAPLVGVLADRLARTIPPALARRRVAMTCLTIAAIFVFIGARLPTPTLAILALGLSVACLVSCEAPYWTSTTAMAGDAAGSAGGALNLMGNLGGVMSIWLVPIMKDAWGWAAMLAFWEGSRWSLRRFGWSRCVPTPRRSRRSARKSRRQTGIRIRPLTASGKTRPRRNKALRHAHRTTNFSISRSNTCARGNAARILARSLFRCAAAEATTR